VYPLLDRSSQWAQIYFYGASENTIPLTPILAFYVCVNLIALNLFVGFVIDAFLEVWKEQEEKKADVSKWRERLRVNRDGIDTLVRLSYTFVSFVLPYA
jgi:hypothetical protein